LLDNNFDVMVERDPQRIFDDQEFEECVQLKDGHWMPKADEQRRVQARTSQRVAFGSC
jgi:hypothetical protein